MPPPCATRPISLSLETVARSRQQTRFSYPPLKLLATRNLDERHINYSRLIQSCNEYNHTAYTLNILYQDRFRMMLILHTKEGI